MQTLDTRIQKRVKEWLSPIFDQPTKDTIQALLDKDPQELQEAFYKDLEFGTGGMRGVMGVGTNRINKYTLGKSTQGLSNYLREQFPNEPLKAVIAYDCRHNSDTLAQTVADVFSANGIQVYLFADLRPTPELSFAVKYLNCHCGIVLTASHNPPEYNGYKVYWQDGGQLVPPQDKAIIAQINILDYGDIQFESRPKLITQIDKTVDNAFVQASVQNGSKVASQQAKDAIQIVFTSLHGTSITAVPQTLEQAGYKNVAIVKAQEKPDGDFPTVQSPNPEEPEALAMALKLADDKGADIVIGTDPDCDRLGIAVRNSEGALELLNGNQTMIVMTWFLLEQLQKQQKLTAEHFVASTIVSTPMMRILAEDYQVDYKEVLTGFKWIAKLIKDHPQQHFIGGGEESFGYMVGDFVRDKDAVTATLLACEIVAQTQSEGSSFYQKLLELYTQYGCYKEQLISLVKKGIEGADQIKQMMIDLRQHPLQEIGGSKTLLIQDYQSGISTNLENGKTETLGVPKANVLIYHTEDGSKIAARPSGTEPKIKFYISVVTELDQVENYHQIERQLDQKIERIKGELQLT